MLTIVTTNRKFARRAASAVLLGALTLSAAYASGNAPPPNAPSGPDVASHQHPGGASIDWTAVRNSGQQFALVKATESTHYVNPHFQGDSLAVKANGLVRGSYHYADPSKSPIEQALFYSITTLASRIPGDLPPVLDLEDAKGLAPQALQDWTRTFVNTMDLLSGKRTIIYTYPSFWRHNMANTHEFANRPLWIANYNNRSEPTLPLVGGWTAWTFWQYTSTARIPGVKTPIDLNKFNGSAEDLANLTR